MPLRVSVILCYQLINSTCGRVMRSMLTRASLLFTRRFCHSSCMLILAVLLSPPVQAQSAAESTQTVQVRITGIDGELRTNAELLLDIYQLHQQLAPAHFRLRFLQRRGEQQIADALQPFGFYSSKVSSQIIEDNDTIEVLYQVVLGPPVVITTASIEVYGAGQTDPIFQQVLAQSPLRVGAVLDHRVYERLKSQLRNIAAERGYYDARFVQNHVDVEITNQTAAVYLRYNTGERYRFGDIRFCCAELDASFLERYPQFTKGDAFSTEELFNLQVGLTNSDYFETVEILPLWNTANDYQVPVEINLTANQRNRYQLGLGYGTDTGARATLGFDRRWVNRRGHKISSVLRLSELENTGSFNYTIPGSNPVREQYNFIAEVKDTSYLEQRSTLYRAVARSSYADSNWQRSMQIGWLSEDFSFGSMPSRTSTLLVPSAEWSLIRSHSETNNRNLVDDGYRMSLMIQGSSKAIGSDLDFAAAKLTAKWVQRLSNNWRLLARGEIGALTSSDFDAIPPSLRFFTGGDYTVRGYAYHQLGPVNSEGVVIGGRYLVNGSLEFDYQLNDAWRLAVFTDVGNTMLSWDTELKQSVGFGARWISPIGPVRIDIASAINESGTPWRLHFTLGPDL